LIEIGTKRRGKYCAVVRKEGKKYYVCTNEPDKKEDVYYVALLIEKDAKRGVVVAGRRLKIYEIKGDRVEEKEEEIPEGVEDVTTYLQAKYVEIPYFITESFEQLKKRYSERPWIKVLLFSLPVVLVLMSGIFYYNHQKKKEELKALRGKMKIVRLSEKQKLEIKKGISHEFIEELANLVNGLPELQRIRVVELRYVNVPAREGVPERLYGEMKYVIESVYPMEGSVKSGKYYVKTTKRKLKGKVKVFKNTDECVKEILKSGLDLVRTNPLTFEGTFKNSFRAFRFLEELYGCPFYFERVLMGKTHFFRLVLR